MICTQCRTVVACVYREPVCPTCHAEMAEGADCTHADMCGLLVEPAGCLERQTAADLVAEPAARKPPPNKRVEREPRPRARLSSLRRPRPRRADRQRAQGN